MHKTSVRMESRVGMIQPDYRVICKCGWMDKAISREAAKILGDDHENKKTRKR